MTRSLRRWIGWICLAGFAFAQVTLAAYACPLRGPMPDRAAVASGDDVLAQCPGHAGAPVPDNGPVCEAHCDGQTGVTGGGTVVVPPLVLAPFPVAPSPDPQAFVPSRVARTAHDANAAAPPVAQRFCRLLN